ncbi:MAG TPA: HYR domain-containing protein [Pyrinomonadaceae bacterium]
MKTATGRQITNSQSNTSILIGILIFLVAVLAVSFSGRANPVAASSAGDDAFVMPRPELATSYMRPSKYRFFLVAPPQAGSEMIETFASDCTTPQTDFDLGATVCAKISGAPLPVDGRAQRRIGWVSPYGSLAQGADITTDPQNGTYLIPTSQTQTFTDAGGGTVVVDNRGTWSVNTFSASDGSRRASAYFTVHDPATPYVDLSVGQSVSEANSTIPAGSSGEFSIIVSNRGPDAGANVVLTDTVPSNTTFVAIAQTSGPSFSCTTPAVGGTGTITCSIATLAKGDVATFDLAYNVNAGTPNGTLITNNATISSDTAELVADDNSSTRSATVGGVGGGTGTCSVACPDDITTPANTVDQNNDPGAIVHFSPPSGNTECGTIVVDHCNDCFFPQGTTIVTATGVGDSCSFAVTVTPAGSAPTISCPSNQTGTADSNCEANIAVGTASATGTNVTVIGFRSDGRPMYACDEFGNCTRNSSDAPFSAGTTTINWYAYSHDVAGPYDAQTGDEESHRTGSATCTQTVVVNDVTPPVITATDSTASADENCQAAVPDYSSTVSDNCACSSSDTSETCEGHPHITYTQTPAAGTLVGLGPTTVHIEANDGSSNNNGAGNTTTKDVTFTVNDTTAPMISCPVDIVTSNDPGTCSATVNPGTATATDNCDSSPTIAATRSDNQSLNAPYPKGTTIITWSATDDAGNTSSCNQSVTVNDTEAPTISCPANITKNNDPGVCGAVVTYTAPVGSDNCPGATTAQTAGLPSGSTFPVGTTTNTFEVTDSSGNKTSCSFTVTVNDVENPVISCPSSQTLEPTCPSGAVGNWTAPVGTDNCPGAVTTRTAGPAPGSVFAAGTTTTITYTVNDAHGNSASCSFTITVKTVSQTISDLKASVNSSSLTGTQKQGLIAKLNAAQDALDQGHPSTACAKLADFINSVQIFIDHGDIPASTGNAWISTATNLRNAIGCTNNPCS